VSRKLVESVAQIARHAWRGVHWKRAPGEHPGMVREPLKIQHLERHVAAGPYVGLGCIAPGESSTRVAVLDLDSHKGEVEWSQMVSHAMVLCRSLERDGAAPIPFRSSGGQGIHIILLWEEPQDAYSVRELLRVNLEANGYRSGAKGVKSGEIEIFPKQDSVPPDGFGSMFVLPLAGKSLPLDPLALELRGKDYAETTRWPISNPVKVIPKPSTPVQTSSTISASPGTNLAEIRSALQAIPNEGAQAPEYDTWRNIVFAIHHASGGSPDGLALAHEFSSRSSKYDATFLDERVWPHIRSDRSGKVVTERTIFDLARKHGYEEPIIDDFEVLPPLSDDLPEGLPEILHGDASKDYKRFQVIPDPEFRARPSPKWIVRGIFPQAELVVIYGESQSGKSFLALDLAAAISRGTAWRGLTVQQGRVVYIAAEGAGGFRNRLEAYAKHNEIAEVGIGVIADTPNLLQKEDIRAVVIELKRYGRVDIVIVDTFAQTTPGANENSAEDVGKALAHCKVIHRATGALVVLIHHAGKDLSKGARGWSGLRAACDAEIEVTRRDNERLATVTKQKDGSDGAVYPFRLTVVPIGEDDTGEQIDSCVVQHVDAQSPSRREPTGETQRLLWRIAHGLADLGDGEVTIKAVITEALRHLPEGDGERDRRPEILRRELVRLADKGFVELQDDRILLGRA
jgi:archaellum biogenesis ATPase FlaH